MTCLFLSNLSLTHFNTMHPFKKSVNFFDDLAPALLPVATITKVSPETIKSWIFPKMNAHFRWQIVGQTGDSHNSKFSNSKASKHPGKMAPLIWLIWSFEGPKTYLHRFYWEQTLFFISLLLFLYWFSGHFWYFYS